MVKQITVIVLLCAFAIQSFNRTVIVVNYYTNTNSFAKNCINKAKPKLHCNGKCQLIKKLKQEENKDKQNPERRNDNKDEVLFCSKSQTFQYNSNVSIALYFPMININQTKDIAFDFFQPPQA